MYRAHILRTPSILTHTKLHERARERDREPLISRAAACTAHKGLCDFRGKPSVGAVTYIIPFFFLSSSLSSTSLARACEVLRAREIFGTCRACATRLYVQRTLQHVCKVRADDDDDVVCIRESSRLWFSRENDCSVRAMRPGDAMSIYLCLRV